MYEHLFSPIKIGTLEVKNRIAMMAMGASTPRLMNVKTAAYTKDGADYYIERAKGGAGLIITGLVPVDPMTETNAVAYPDEYIKEMRYLTDGVHQYGAKIFVQLTARTGRTVWVQSQKSADKLPSPSEISNFWDPTIKHPEITKDKIHKIVKNYGQVAWEVQQAGGDGVEIHAMHEGYLLDQFTMSFFNKRTDEYGGSLENRLRILKEIVDEIKKRCGIDFPVAIRYSVRSYIKGLSRGALPGEYFEEKGRNLTESIEAAKMLENYGYDLLDCDNGSYDSWFWAHPPVYMPKACNLEDVRKIKAEVQIPVICAGRFDDPDLAEKEIANGHIDMMGMARPFLADSEIANKIRDGRTEEIRPCIACHQGCFGRIYQKKDICCAVNPACARESEYGILPAEKKKKILVVGGGLAGMEAARVCATRGHTVDLYEKKEELGGVFIAASMPEFKEADRRLLTWYKKQMQNLGVKLHLGEEAKQDIFYNYDEIFLASGALPKRLLVSGFESQNVVYAEDALRNGKIDGQNILIVGGGLTGCEIAYQYAKCGKNVTIAEMSDEILNVFGLCAANYNMLLELIDYYKITVLKNAEVKAYENGEAVIRITKKSGPNIAGRARTPYGFGGKGLELTMKIPADCIIISAGFISDQSFSALKEHANIHFIGDAKQPANVMEAIWGAYEATRTV